MPADLEPELTAPHRLPDLRLRRRERRRIAYKILRVFAGIDMRISGCLLHYPFLQGSE